MSGIDSFFGAINNFFFPEASPLAEVLLEEDGMAAATPKQNPREEWTPSRPVLTHPSCLPFSDRRLLAVTDTTRELGDKILEMLGTRLNYVKDKIRDISAENMAILREAAQRAQDSNFWSLLKKIATALIAAVSVIFGASVVASGGSALIGGAMIASGILSLANFALSELGTWDWIASQLSNENEDRKRQIAMALPMAVGILAGGIGLVGSVNGVVTGAINFAEKAAFIAQSIFSIFDGVSTLGKGVADSRLLWTQADTEGIQGKLTVERENFAITIDEIKASLGTFRNISKKTKTAVQSIARSNIQLTR